MMWETMRRPSQAKAQAPRPAKVEALEQEMPDEEETPERETLLGSSSERGPLREFPGNQENRE